MLSLASSTHIALATVPMPIGSFCDEQQDTLMSNGTIVSQSNYSICMDFAGAQWRTAGLGPTTEIFTGGVAYTIDPATKVCTTKAMPGQGPPNAIPFSFLVLDDDSRGSAVKVGTAQIDGVTADHWQHNRAGMGTMNWYLLATKNGGDALLRTTFVKPNGDSGSRDFSRKWATPFAAGSFTVPANCPKPSETATAATMLRADAAFGDAAPTYTFTSTSTSTSKQALRAPLVCSPCYEKPPACTGSETSVQITGVTGDFCSPLCVQNECPKGDGSFTAKPSCVLETQGSSKPTQCALICTPGANGACPAGATCQAIQGEGICTYPSSL